MVEHLGRQLKQVQANGQQWHEARGAIEEFNRVMASGDQEKIGAIRVRLNSHLKKLIDRIAVAPDGSVAVTPAGSEKMLAKPALTRKVQAGGFVFGEAAD